MFSDRELKKSLWSFIFRLLGIIVQNFKKGTYCAVTVFSRVLLFCFSCARPKQNSKTWYVVYLKSEYIVLHQLCLSSNSEATKPKRSILLSTNWSAWQLVLMATEFPLASLLQIHNTTLPKRQVRLALIWGNSELKCKITALCLLIKPTIQPYAVPVTPTPITWAEKRCVHGQNLPFETGIVQH